MDNTSKLLEIFSNDPLGLLEVKPKSSPLQTEDNRLMSSFEEINAFIDLHQKKPQRNISDISESQLFSRLKGICEDFEKVEQLREQDRHHLLPPIQNAIHSIDDILGSDSFSLLDDAEDIFTLKHVPQHREETDFVARREPCKDFDTFEPLFKQCHIDLKAGKRKLAKFNEKFLEEGNFFILKGMMVYLYKIIGATKDKHNKMDGRTRCIFDNGTQSNMLMRSLGKGLYEDGYFVSEHEDKVLDKLSHITKEDESTGYIYILKSKSTKPEILDITNLYKIGYSKSDIKERTKNAENEPTYLMAPVSIMGVYECYNMNPQKLEQLLHRFFGKSCLNIDIFDHEGQRHMPREWFIASIDIIETAIEMIISGHIVNYRYDNVLKVIIEK